MAKAKSKKLQKVADELFKDNPEENKVWITSDGQGFFKENHAKNNASDKDLEDPEVFFREGHQNEDNQDLEDVLHETEETVKEQEAVINKIIDVSNTEAEETVDVSETDHEAVQAVVELRAKYEENIEQTNFFKEEIKDELDFNTAVVELIKNNDTKLAEDIRALIPVKS